MAKLGKLPSPGEIAWTYIKYNWFQPLVKRPFLPTTLVLYVTYRCNSRCIMCGIWENQGLGGAAGELTTEELDRILTNQLFANVHHLNINGGEPTLRDDLPDLIQVAVSKLPRLRHITMSSNGLLADGLAPQIECLGQLCAQKNIRFSLAMSVHGVADVADRVFGIVGASDKQVKALTALRELALDGELCLSLHCVITDALQGLLCWSQERNLPISFALGEVRDRFLNRGKADQVRIADGQIGLVIGFFRELSRDKGLFKPSAFRYHHVANMLQFGQKRTMSCHYAMGGVILGPQGELYYCPHSQALGNCRDQPAYKIYYDGENLNYRRSGLVKDECLHCPPYTFNRLEFEKDVLKYLKFLMIPLREV
jgi:MoaA/NifB/PqqE/SkfB family radical SAM enzyme